MFPNEPQVVTYKSVERSVSAVSSLNSGPPIEQARPRSGSEGTVIKGQRTQNSSSLMPPLPIAANGTLLSHEKSYESSMSSSTKTSHMNVVECIDFCDVGNVLGEIGILEQKVNEVDAICETDVQVFFIGKEKVEMLIKEHPVLKDRLWKLLGVHIASTLLMQLSEYQVNVQSYKHTSCSRL